METAGKELKVSAIKNGTVLDHVPANKLFEVITILGLRDCPNQITFGMNLDSKLLGKKAIIKIADRFFEETEINKVALVAPDAKINIIKDFEVVEKKVLKVPEQIIGIVKCANPKCVTNHQPIATKFVTTYENGELKLHCHYCEKNTSSDNLKIITEN
jgi:aspartate carbamoyltransferase regulatory subunit